MVKPRDWIFFPLLFSALFAEEIKVVCAQVIFFQLILFHFIPLKLHFLQEISIDWLRITWNDSILSKIKKKEYFDFWKFCVNKQPSSVAIKKIASYYYFIYLWFHVHIIIIIIVAQWSSSVLGFGSTRELVSIYFLVRMSVVLFANYDNLCRISSKQKQNTIKKTSNQIMKMMKFYRNKTLTCVQHERTYQEKKLFKVPSL